MILNEAGKRTSKWWHELKRKYQNICLHGHIVMPNHFHGIIEIKNTSTQADSESVGADLRVCPSSGQSWHGQTPRQGQTDQQGQAHRQGQIHRKGQTHRSAPTVVGVDMSDNNVQTGGHIGPPLHAMVQWFKTMTTNEYIRGVKQNGWQRFNKKLWQRNYYEHIIRSEKSYQHIFEYIQTNPLKWREDKYYDPYVRKHI